MGRTEAKNVQEEGAAQFRLMIEFQIEDHRLACLYTAAQVLIYTLLLAQVLRNHHQNLHGNLMKILVVYDLLLLAKVVNMAIMIWVVLPDCPLLGRDGVGVSRQRALWSY